MKNFGERLKELRLAVEKSQLELANVLGITVKSIQRYEKGYRPDTYTLAKIATYFNVSTDYLLGLKGYVEMEKEREECLKDNLGFYKNYIKCLNEYEIQEADYYWITLKDDYIEGQTEWVGWADENQTQEIRRLCLVKPEAAIQICTQLKGKPMVLNSEEDAITFRIYGGEAIVRTDICEQYLPEFAREYICKRKNI